MSDKIAFRFKNFKASYSSNIYFKIKVSLKEQNITKEGTETHKYEKNKKELEFEETLEIDNLAPLKSTSKFTIYLLVYTKSGFKPAGTGELIYSKIKKGENNQVDIKKCPLGNVSLDVIIDISGNNKNKKDIPIENKIQKEETNENIKEDIKEKPKSKEKPKKIIKNDDDFEEETFTKPKTQNKINNIDNNENKVKNIPIPKKENNNNDFSCNQSTFSNISLVSMNNMNNLNNKNIEPISNSNHNENMLKKVDGNLDNQLKAKDKIIDELKEKNNYFEEENSQLNGIIKDLKEEKRKLLEEKNEQIRQQREENEKIKKELEDKQIEFITLTNTYNVLLEEKKGLDTNTKQHIELQAQNKIEIEKIKLENNKLLTELNTLKDENQILQGKFETNEKELLELKEKNTSFKENINIELSTKQTDLLTQIEKVREKDIEIDKLKEELNKIKEENEGFQSKMEMQEQIAINNENNEIQNLKEQIEIKDKLINEIKSENEKLKLTNLKLEEDFNFAQSEKENSYEFAKNSERKLKDEILNQRNTIEKYSKTIQDLTDENLILKKENESHKRELKQFESNQLTNDSFLMQMQDIQKSAAEKEVKLMQIKEENELLKKEINNLKDNSKKKGSNNIDNKKYLKEIEILKNQKTSLEEDLNYYKNLNMTFVDSEKNKTLLESENIQVKNELVIRTAACEKFQKEILELSQRNKDLEDELMMKTEKIGQLLNELVEAEK